MVRFFAALAGSMVSLFVLVLSNVMLVNRASEFHEPWTLFGAMLLMAVATLLSFGFTRLLALAYATRLLRGRSAVAWCSPSRCLRFSSWLAFEWNFFSKGGRQRGERLLGLEVALEGTLG